MGGDEFIWLRSWKSQVLAYVSVAHWRKPTLPIRLKNIFKGTYYAVLIFIVTAQVDYLGGLHIWRWCATWNDYSCHIHQHNFWTKNSPTTRFLALAVNCKSCLSIVASTDVTRARDTVTCRVLPPVIIVNLSFLHPTTTNETLSRCNEFKTDEKGLCACGQGYS